MRKPKAWQATRRVLPLFVVGILALALALPVLADGPPDQAGKGCRDQQGECPQTAQQDRGRSGKPENPGKAQQDHGQSGKPENPGKAQQDHGQSGKPENPGKAHPSVGPEVQTHPETQVLSEIGATVALGSVVRERGKPFNLTFSNISQANTMWVNNSAGLKNLRVSVNGQRFQVAGLKDLEVREIDISSAMVEGSNNTIVLTALGKPGRSAEVSIGE